MICKCGNEMSYIGKIDAYNSGILLVFECLTCHKMVMVSTFGLEHWYEHIARC